MLTPIEFKKKIAESKHTEWFQSQKVEFNFYYINQKFELTGVSSVYEYINKEFISWEKISKQCPDELKYSYDYFNSMFGTLEHIVSKLINEPINQIEAMWRQVLQQIQNINNKPLPFNSSEAQFLIDLSITNHKYFKGAYDFLFSQNRFNNSSRDEFIGAIIAYEFLQKDVSDIITRRNSEKASLTRLKNEFHEYLNRTEQDVINHLNSTNLKYKEYLKLIDELKIEKEQLFDEWYSKSQKNFNEFDNDSKERIKQLEETYETKLKLEKPAKYWDLKSKTFYNQAIRTRTILIWVIGLSSAVLITILVTAPDWIFNVVLKGNTVAIVRWSIVFITLISLIAFIVRALTKFMFSSFHLARDAEERHTLTYFYLALLKDSKVSDKDKELIMQSLFSRAETGLLKDDAAPTMPNDIVGKMMMK